MIACDHKRGKTTFKQATIKSLPGSKLVGKETPDQYREWYNTLLKNYRKFLAESKQTIDFHLLTVYGGSD